MPRTQPSSEEGEGVSEACVNGSVRYMHSTGLFDINTSFLPYFTGIFGIYLFPPLLPGKRQQRMTGARLKHSLISNPLERFNTPLYTFYFTVALFPYSRFWYCTCQRCAPLLHPCKPSSLGTLLGLKSDAVIERPRLRSLLPLRLRMVVDTSRTKCGNLDRTGIFESG